MLPADPINRKQPSTPVFSPATYSIGSNRPSETRLIINCLLFPLLRGKPLIALICGVFYEALDFSAVHPELRKAIVTNVINF